jgi:arsenate reductase-like glutaredoxin family protein
VPLGEVVDAKKIRYDAVAVQAILKGVEEIVSMKGRRFTHLRLKKDKPTTDEILAAILGPFGTLRAPAFRKGKTLIVGFDEETYARLLK